MQLQIALADTDAPITFAIARMTERHRCPLLGPALREAASKVIGGMPVVLLHREPNGDVRSYGREDLVVAAAGLDLDRQSWATFEIDDALAVAAAAGSREPLAA